MEVAKLTAKLEVNDTDFQRKVKQAERSMQSLAQKADAAAGDVRELGQASDRTADSERTLATVTTRAASATAELSRSANPAADAVQNLGRHAGAASPRLAELERRAGRLASMTTDVGRTLTMGVTVPLVGFGAAALKAAVDMESLRRGLTAVSGSSEAAAAQMVRLREVAKMPGLGFEEAVKGSIKLQAAGLSANTAERAIRGFGNALATVGGGREELGGVITALSQIQSKGKVSAEEINQLAERLPQIRKVMQEAFGTSDTEALQGMGISSEEFISKIIEQLEKLPKANAGAKESFEDLGDTAKIALGKIGDAALPAANVIAKDLAKAIDQAATAFSKLPSEQQQAILIGGAITAAVGPAILALGSLAGMIVNVRTLMGTLGGGAASKAVTQALPSLSEFAKVGGSTAQGGLMGAIGGGLSSLGGRILATGPGGVAAIGAGVTAAAGYGISQLPPGLRQIAEMGAPIAGQAARFFDPRGKSSPAMSVKGNAAQFGPPVLAAPQTFTRDTSKADAKRAKVAAGASDARFNAEMARAGNVAAATGLPEAQAQREAALAMPIITRRRKELAEAAKALEPRIKEDVEAAREYYRIQAEDAQLQGQAIQFQQGAAKEVEQNRKKAEQEARKRQQERKQHYDNLQRFHENEFRAQLTEAEVAIAATDTEEKALLRKTDLVPIIEARQKKLLAESKALEPHVRSSWDAALRRQELQSQFAQLELEKQQLVSASIEEGRTLEKKAADEAKRNAEKARQQVEERASAFRQISDKIKEAFQKMNADRLGLASARVSLAEAQLANLPGTERQRKQALQPLLIQQLRETSRGIQGESELDRLRRLTDAEGIKGRLLDTVGNDPRRRMIALQQLNAIQGEAMNAPVTSRAVVEAERAARDAERATGKTAVMQLVLNGEITPQKLMQAFETLMREQNRRSGLAGAAY